MGPDIIATWGPVLALVGLALLAIASERGSKSATVALLGLGVLVLGLLALSLWAALQLTGAGIDVFGG